MSKKDLTEQIIEKLEVIQEQSKEILEKEKQLEEAKKLFTTFNSNGLSDAKRREEREKREKREKEIQEKFEKKFPFTPEELKQRKQTTLVDSVLISVDCKSNDSVDIRCGGPLYLGYDFLVGQDEVEEMKTFIVQQIKENNQPFIEINSAYHKKVEMNHLWTKTDIARCIFKGYEGKPMSL